MTNQGLGKGQSLDTYSDGENAPFMGETGEYSGQFWKLSPEGFVGASGTAGQAAQSPRAAEQAYSQQQFLGKPPAAAQPKDAALFPPPLRTFSFEPSEQKLIPGTSAQKKEGFEDCDGIVHDVDRIGGLALVSQFFQNGCYTDGRYNHAGYQVERGTLKSLDGRLAIEAYRVSGPARKATDFLTSKHILSIQIATAGDYTLVVLQKADLAGKILMEKATTAARRH